MMWLTKLLTAVLAELLGAAVHGESTDTTFFPRSQQLQIPITRAHNWLLRANGRSSMPKSIYHRSNEMLTVIGAGL